MPGTCLPGFLKDRAATADIHGVHALLREDQEPRSNLLKHRGDASGPAPSPDFTDAVVGMIDERTKDLPSERPGERRKGFEALFSNGTVSSERIVGGYDLFDFVPTDYRDFTLPEDYGGTSGSAVWRIYLKVEGEKPDIAAVRLWGMPYY